jgi:hypothetical protein
VNPTPHARSLWWASSCTMASASPTGEWTVAQRLPKASSYECDDEATTPHPSSPTSTSAGSTAAWSTWTSALAWAAPTGQASTNVTARARFGWVLGASPKPTKSRSKSGRPR